MYQPINIFSLHVIILQRFPTNEEHADEAYAMWPDKVLGPIAMESGRKAHWQAMRVSGSGAFYDIVNDYLKMTFLIIKNGTEWNWEGGFVAY